MMPPLLKCEIKPECCNVDFTQDPTYYWCRNVVYNKKCKIHSQCGQSTSSSVYFSIPGCKKLEPKIFKPIQS